MKADKIKLRTDSIMIEECESFEELLRESDYPFILAVGFGGDKYGAIHRIAGGGSNVRQMEAVKVITTYICRMLYDQTHDASQRKIVHDALISWLHDIEDSVFDIERMYNKDASE